MRCHLKRPAIKKRTTLSSHFDAKLYSFSVLCEYFEDYVLHPFPERVKTLKNTMVRGLRKCESSTQVNHLLFMMTL